MKLFLDTHVLLWWLRDDPSLGSRTKALLADPAAQLLVSVASFWEIAIKSRRGQIDISGSALCEQAVASDVSILDVRLQHLAALERIQFRSDHKDPFDHMILAQAVAEGAVLVTHDRQLLAYDVDALGVK